MFSRIPVGIRRVTAQLLLPHPHQRAEMHVCVVRRMGTTTAGTRHTRHDRGGGDPRVAPRLKPAAAHDGATQRPPRHSVAVLPPSLHPDPPEGMALAQSQRQTRASASPEASRHRRSIGTPEGEVGPRTGGTLRRATGSTGTTDTARVASSVTEDAYGPYDPVTVVRLDSRTKQVHLNPLQKDLLWRARQAEYHGMLQRIVVCLEAHHDPVEKCRLLHTLHAECVQRRLRLRADTYEDIFHLFYAVAMQADLGRAGSVLVEDDLMGRSAATALPIAAASTLTEHALLELWTMYRYMVDSGTNPTARTIQHVMGILERYCLLAAPPTAAHASPSPTRKPAALTLVEARAHSLMLELDRARLAPTEYTLVSYIGVCDCCGAMHLAVARMADYRKRHERQASPGLSARLISGLVHNGHYDEAMSAVSTLDSVAMTTHLLNSILDAARHSSDPASAFTFYRAVVVGQQGRRMPAEASHIAPSLHSMSILLEVMRSTGDFGELDLLLEELQRHRISGSVQFLNKLLGALLLEGASQGKGRGHAGGGGDVSRRAAEAVRLASTMDRRGVRVFDEHRKALKTLHPAVPRKKERG